VKYLHLESSSVALLQAIFIVYFYYPHDIKGDFPMDAENYGTLIKNLRIQNGLTQNQVAVALGVTPGYIRIVENGRTAMSLRILTYYARLVGCSLHSLVGELEPEYTETALDRELYQAIVKLDMKTKEKLLKTIELWTA
jgi:transcriptional regulator with XRE-family HTH domain